MSKYSGNGQFVVDEITLVTDLQEIDLSAAFVQLDIYESIFNHTMSGHISIIDVFNLQDLLPLYGNEKLRIDFHTRGVDQSLAYTGYIYKISEKHRMSEHSSGYTLYFISEKAINSHQTNVNLGFNDTPSKIVESIFNSIESKTDQKELVTIETKGLDTYTFGSVKPLQAISVLSKHASSNNNEYGYVFYEDNLKYNFVPIQSMYNKDPIRYYKSRNSGLYDVEQQRVQESYNNIQDFRIMNENSYIDRMLEGQHGASFCRLDLFSKQYEVFEYDKEQFYDKTKSLGELAHKKDLDISYENRTSLRYGIDPQTDFPSMSQGIMSKIELNTIRCEITIFGDSLLTCGEVVFVNLPIWNKDQADVTDMLTGNFLMTNIHHQLTQDNKFIQNIMIQKEAYEPL